MAGRIGHLLEQASRQLAGASDSARLDAEVLLAHVTGRNRSYFYTWPEHELSERQALQLQALVERRLAGEPIAHLTGSREFWSLPLLVSPDTLIPRPETELLVEIALQLFSGDSQTPLSLADLGTGTGAIALAIASERPAWCVYGCDRVPAAVRLANRNKALLALTNVTFVESNWCDQLPAPKLDLIVSNPPYIKSDDPHLTRGDVRFEPLSALVADEQGLRDIQIIAGQAGPRLVPGGWLLLEHGYDQGAAVREILHGAGFTHVETRLDLAGLERATLGQWPGVGQLMKGE